MPEENRTENALVEELKEHGSRLRRSTDSIGQGVRFLAISAVRTVKHNVGHKKMCPTQLHVR